MDDIFCKIIRKEIPADIVMETADVIAIRDIHPQAPEHVLLIPKHHIADLTSASDDDYVLIGKAIATCREVAKLLNLEYKGFRLIANQGPDGGQLVPHVHVHMLGGKHLGPKIVQ